MFSALVGGDDDGNEGFTIEPFFIQRFSDNQIMMSIFFY
jgi:hypothetical protein